MNPELIAFKETYLIEELEKIYLSGSLTKNAGLFASLGGESAGDWIKNFSKDYLKDSSEVPGGYFTSIVNLLAPSVLFRINPFLGLFYLGLSAIGFDLSDIAVKVAKKLKPKLENEEPVSRAEVAQAVNEVSGVSATASCDANELKVFSDYNCIEDFSLLLKEAKQAQKEIIKESWGGSSWDSYGKKTLFQKIFGKFLDTPYGKNKLFGIGKGLVFWVITTILSSVALLAVSQAVMGRPKKESLKEQPKDQTEELKTEPKSTIQDSDKDQESKPKQALDSVVWLERWSGNNIQDMLLTWAFHFYPKLNEYKDIDVEEKILKSGKFNAVLGEIERANPSIRSGYVSMPDRWVTSRDTTQLKKQVVDKFIDQDLFKELNAPTT